MKTREKLEILREKMKGKGIDAWIIPTSDPHQSEYMADHWKIRRWFSGFSGSAGVCVVTMEKAGLWTDSRYWLQAEEELTGSGIDLFKAGSPGVPTYNEWLVQELSEGSVVGFDGAVQSVYSAQRLKKSLASKQAKLKYDEDLLSGMWADRPEIPEKPAGLLSTEYSGESFPDKIKRVVKALEHRQADYHLISALDEIAWLFNLRGRDIAYNPVVISYAFLSKADVCLFINEAKLELAAKTELESNNVKFFPYENIYEFLSLIPQEKKLLLNPVSVSQKARDAVSCEVLEGASIITPMKGIKNAVEQSGFREAHIEDGVSLCRWIKWIKEQAGKIEINEYSAGEKLEEFRKQGKLYQGASFAPIVGYKSNGAIVHYSAKRETAREISNSGLLLVDSGGQYLNGTTDVTRTISLGNITDEERYYFTLVLSGHIDLARAIFPKGTSGAMLDTYSRTALWKEKLNYGHGTGHGVGHYLCVHEGPQSISPRSTYPVLPGSVTSNEPGIYLAGKFGIRIENMILCNSLGTTDYGEFCNFETLTQCPIERDLVDKTLLNEEQINWLNDYHAEVYKKLSPLMTEAEKAWLHEQTKAL